MNKLPIPTNTTLALRRTDTLIALTNKLLTAKTMSDDELWDWWCGLSDEWKANILSCILTEDKFRYSFFLEFKNGDFFTQCDVDYIEFNWSNKLETVVYLRKIFDLTSIDISVEDMGNIECIGFLKNLRKIRLWADWCSCYIPFFDISPLACLEKLEDISINQTQVSNISILSNLRNLKYLDLSQNDIQNIHSLHKITGLKYLNLKDNQIQDITPLQSLKELTELYLGKNPISRAQIDWLQQQLPSCLIHS